MPDDFGYDGGNNQDIDSTNLDKNNKDKDTTDLSNKNEDTNNNNNGTTVNNNNDTNNNNDDGTKNDDKEDKEEKHHDLETGTVLSVDGIDYTIDDKGNVVDKDGKVFKEAKDVKEWIDSFETQEVKENEDDNEISVKKLQEALDISIVDENDNEIEFDNTTEGVASYVQQVIENAREEDYQVAISTLFKQYPFVEDIINYYNANGHSLNGYGQVPDRSNITIDEKNEAQQEYIIRTAWEEQGRKGSVDNYIQYLKSTGTLLSAAEEELEGLKENDKLYREKIQQEAQEREEEERQNMIEYWNQVHNVVKSRKIAGYTIPESIVVNRDGQKTVATVEDFFNYIYQVDNEGKSRYNKDIENEDPQVRLQNDILRAYLKFTGGNYTNLVDMAINNEKVNKLILKSKENKKSTISVRKPETKHKGKEIDFGY